jgi:site-specific DNA-methyltransferase (adenine-specific)
MDLEVNKIYNMDCIEGICSIKDKSISSIITDPPYFIGMTHNGKKGEMTDLAICKPFYNELFREFKRVLKDEGCIYLFTDWRTYHFYYPILSEYVKIRNMLVWNKISGPGASYAMIHELIIFANQSNKTMKGSNVFILPAFCSGAKKSNGEKIHPTQKPVELIEKFILDSTSEGDTILDCFMGVGTTAIACIKTNRHYIGFEVQIKYYDIANERIKNFKAVKSLDFKSLSR